MAHAKPNLTLARLVTENYIDSADSTTDLVYFTKEAHDKLSDIFKLEMFAETHDAATQKATHEMVDAHLYYALQKKLGLE